MFVRPGKLRVNEPRPDDLNRGRLKINLSFTLPPGAYATLVVRRTLWFAAEGARPVLLQKKEQAAKEQAAVEAAPAEQAKRGSKAASGAKRKERTKKPRWGRPESVDAESARGDEEQAETARPEKAQPEPTIETPQRAERRGFRARQKEIKEVREKNRTAAQAKDKVR